MYTTNALSSGASPPPGVVQTVVWLARVKYRYSSVGYQINDCSEDLGKEGV